MVANYLVMVNLIQLKDTIWALILPIALGPFNILVMRTFFKKTVPDSIIESARIDGASEMKDFHLDRLTISGSRNRYDQFICGTWLLE